MAQLSRRIFIAAGAATAIPAPGRRPRHRYPFTLGVASGDPLPGGVVIWTRLAPEPLAVDGHGGLGDEAIPVKWEVAEDEAFRRVVRRGRRDAVYALGHSLHVEVEGLRPGREYWYRFKVGSHVSPVGRTVTAPPADALERLTLGVASCARYEHGYFTAYARMAAQRPDLIVHLGDYIYEKAPHASVPPSGIVRDHVGPETTTLAGYRRRYAQYRTDPDLRAAHAVCPWAAVFDDHEVSGNWAGGPAAPPAGVMWRRRAAFQAYYENLPLRRSAMLKGAGMRLHRRLPWGRMATLHMLDTRQYRDVQVCGDRWRSCVDRLDTARTLTGDDQERWLIEGFRRSRARWDIVGQQVFFPQRRRPGDPAKMNMDAWDGYRASRDRIMRGWSGSDAGNLVVLGGDVHAHWAGDIKADFDDPGSETLGAKLACSSISTGGDGEDIQLAEDPWLETNPHLKYHNMRRGYILVRVGPRKLKADFMGVDYVSRPGAPVRRRATFVVENGRPGVEPTYAQRLAPSATPLTRREIVERTIELET